jgi:hypothetical protein
MIGSWALQRAGANIITALQTTLPAVIVGPGNLARSRLSGGSFAPGTDRRLKAGGSQDWLPHGG